MMINRKYLQKSQHPHPHIGQLIKRVMREKKITQAEVARRMALTPSSIAKYFRQPSLQFGILWNLSMAIGYDFLTALTDYYPPSLPLNEDAKIVKELAEKEQRIADMEKEIAIYKAALGIKA
ncbi:MULTISPECIES: helix-turn-helix domain-containing protein [Chryseobacterium]|jgi:transcriptional regulator with XRE-family HTH domain|uniref:Helix-turn-helix domain-containing protein n=2 Tax=Chryseobacterium nepalense TaxID=1854498 RepID=A0ABY4K4Y2_9FLAO|nr:MULTISPECIES: helix-turn-helix domain-containing protein [Chryseobacterium]UPQ74863.1 helix-turn-helix domain-containing protein [Chryseobacterium nepalense]